MRLKCDPDIQGNKGRTKSRNSLIHLILFDANCFFLLFLVKLIRRNFKNR